MEHVPQVFDKVDYNKNGLIEPLEVEVAVLSLYNIVNKRLPGWQDPPTRDEIQVQHQPSMQAILVCATLAGHRDGMTAGSHSRCFL